MKNLLLITMLTFVPYTAAHAEYGTSNTGTTGAAFLKIAPGARPAAMGEAYAPVADDVYSAFWNPAGLNYLTSGEVSFMHSFWFQGINYSYLAYARPVKFLRGKIGVSMTYLNAGSIERVTSAGDSDGDFTPYDYAAGISYARRIFGVNAGITLKRIYQSINDKSASAFAADMGLRYRMFSDKLDLGVSFSNLGTELKFNKRSAPLPFIVRAGAGYPILKNLIAVVQADLPNDNAASIHAGGEYVLGRNSGTPVALRTGYRTNSSLDSLSGFSAGLGISNMNYSFDYAITPYGKLGFSHRISLSLKNF